MWILYNEKKRMKEKKDKMINMYFILIYCLINYIKSNKYLGWYFVEK